MKEKAVRLGCAFFGPVIDEVVGASDFEPGEPETVRRFLTPVLERTRRPRVS
ncbi:hypothetical protein [Streptomyces sp. NPDC014764]|uniref:hypothetical protein n=1 Tax=Streptomyces sp. NPDC014764 TaxID=3364907 RepID=UPI0036FF147B